MTSPIQVGFAAVDITPPPGLPLRGNYRGDDYAARGVHDPLYARGFVFRNDRDKPLALLQLDLCAIDRSETQIIRDHVAQHTDIPAENILVHAVHIHAGPATHTSSAAAAVDAEAGRRILLNAAAAVVRAAQHCRPLRLMFGRTEENRISFCRRLRCRDGQTHMNWEKLSPDFIVEPLSPIDPEVQTVSFHDDQRRLGAWVNFALHPAILAGDNWLYSADYPGCLVAALRQLHGDDFTAAFLNGPCGNINHIDARDPLQGRGFQMTQRVGYMLAVAAAQAMRAETPLAADKLASAQRRVSLARLRIPDEKIAWSRQVLARAQANPTPGQVDGLPDDFYARLYLEMRDYQDEPDEVEVQVFRIGDLALVALPGEPFCELGLTIKQKSPAPRTIVLELANDAIGYLPIKAAFAQGGYEPTPGSTRYQPGAGETLAANALELIGELFA